VKLSDRDLDIIKYVAKHGGVYYSDLEKYVMQKYGVGIKTVSKVVNRLIKERILWRRRFDKKLFIDIDPAFISFVVEMYALLTKERHRVKYYEKKILASNPNNPSEESGNEEVEDNE